MKRYTKRLTVDLDMDITKKFSMKCIQEDLTKSEVLRRLVSEYIGEVNGSMKLNHLPTSSP